MSKATSFPVIIKNLPEADLHFPGVKGWIFQGNDNQVGFFDIAALGEVEEHSHGAQWGIVLEGEMELTINGQAKMYRKGDTYYIPAGAPHSGNFSTQVRTIDFFDDNDRYPLKKDRNT
jgi:quercetin dioxygenase-like cupin family protein